MNKIKYITTVSLFSAPLIYIYLYPASADNLILSLHVTFVGNPPPVSFGIIASILGSLLGFMYVAATQNTKKPGIITRYRKAELTLVEMKHMSQGEIIAYHSSYNWYSYAGLGFQTLFVIVAIFLEGDTLAKWTTIPPINQVAIVLGLGIIGVSTVTLGIIDFFHTNTLTPLVTHKKRFQLIEIIVGLGGFSIILQTCAVGIFLSLLNSWLSVLTAILGLSIMIFVTNKRGVPISELMAERQLSNEEAHTVLNS